MFWVYILYSPTFDRYYKSQTENLTDRLIMHFEAKTKSTCSAKNWLLVFRQSLNPHISQDFVVRAWKVLLRGCELVKRLRIYKEV